MKRGEQAEWCSKCRALVMPVGTRDEKNRQWVCPTCGTRTYANPS